MSAVLPLPGRPAAAQGSAFADTEILEGEAAPKPRPTMGERLGYIEATNDGRAALRLPRWLPDLRSIFKWIFVNRRLAWKLWCIVGAVLTLPLLVWFWGLFGTPEVVQQTLLGVVRAPATPGWGEWLAHRWWGWLVYAFLIPSLVMSSPVLLLCLPLLPIVALMWMAFGPIAMVMAGVSLPLLFLMGGPRKLIDAVSQLVTLGDQARSDIQRFNDMLGLHGVRRGVMGEPRLMDEAEFNTYRKSARKGEPFNIGFFDGKPFKVRTEKHTLVVAPTRAGKGRDCIIPNLKTYRGSVFTLDPKGENAVLTEAIREAFGPVHVLDPFAITGLPQARYNPLAALKGDNLISGAQTLASALIFGDDGDHWSSAAETLLAGLIVYVCTAPEAPPEPPAQDKAEGVDQAKAAPDGEGTEAAPDAEAPAAPPVKRGRGRPRKTDAEKPAPKDESTEEKSAEDKKAEEPPKPPRIVARDLPTVRRLLMRDLKATLQHMADCPELPDMCRDVGAWGLAAADDEWASIVSTTVEQTKWLSAPQMVEVLSDGGVQVDFSVYRTAVQSVYVCLPAPDFPVYSRWLRLLVAASIDTLTKRLNPDMPYPVRFILDELAQLGTLSKVESALTLSAGYGIQLWGVWQHLKDIERCYPRSGVAGWVSCSGARLVFGAADNETCDYFAKMSGVLTPQQLRTMPEDTMLAMFDGLNPSIVARGVVVGQAEGEGAAT